MDIDELDKNIEYAQQAVIDNFSKALAHDLELIDVCRSKLDTIYSNLKDVGRYAETHNSIDKSKPELTTDEIHELADKYEDLAFGLYLELDKVIHMFYDGEFSSSVEEAYSTLKDDAFFSYERACSSIKCLREVAEREYNDNVLSDDEWHRDGIIKPDTSDIDDKLDSMRNE